MPVTSTAPVLLAVARRLVFVSLMGVGPVFKLSPNQDGTWTETVLYSFCTNYSNSQCIDGAFPFQAGLVLDPRGNLYGTTTKMRRPGCVLEHTSLGCGTVFKISPPSPPGGASAERVLYNFCTTKANNNCSDERFFRLAN